MLQLLFRFFTLGVYIRLLIEVNQFWLVSSIFELTRLDTGSTARTLSFCVAVWVLVVCLKLALVALVRTCRSTRSQPDTGSFAFEELFAGKKNSLKARSHSALQICRQTLLVLMLMCLDFLPLFAKLGIFVTVQAVYFIYTIVVRPQQEAKDNVTDTFNELLMLFLVSFLFICNKKNDWTRTRITLFISSVVVLSVFSCIVHLSKCFNLCSHVVFLSQMNLFSLHIQSCLKKAQELLKSKSTRAKAAKSKLIKI